MDVEFLWAITHDRIPMLILLRWMSDIGMIACYYPYITYSIIGWVCHFAMQIWNNNSNSTPILLGSHPSTPQRHRGVCSLAILTWQFEDDSQPEALLVHVCLKVLIWSGRLKILVCSIEQIFWIAGEMVERLLVVMLLWWLSERGACVQLLRLNTAKTHLIGGGASFPAQVYVEWFNTFDADFVSLDYTPTGSSTGVRWIQGCPCTYFLMILSAENANTVKSPNKITRKIPFDWRTDLFAFCSFFYPYFDIFLVFWECQ